MRPGGALFCAVGGPLLFSALVGLGLNAYLRTAGPPVPQTVGEAVAKRAGTRMIELLGAGADPKLPVAVTVRRIADGRPVKLTPLALAVANGDRDFVRLLLLLQIPWTEDEKRDAYCVAIVVETAWVEQFLPNPGVDATACRMRLERLKAS